MSAEPDTTIVDSFVWPRYREKRRLTVDPIVSLEIPLELLEEIAGLLRDYRELAQEYGLSAAAADAESVLHELTGSVQ